MATVIVTGAGGSAAANFIRSLRRSDRDYRIVATDCDPYLVELADAEARYVLPAAGEPTYLQSLVTVIHREQADYVHPQPDVEVAVLSEHRGYDDVLGRLCLSPHPTVKVCQDKLATANEINDLAPDNCGADSAIALAILLKHGKAWVRLRRGAGSKGSALVRSEYELATWLEFWRVAKDTPAEWFMVSEFLPGREFAFQSVWHNGEIVCSQARERLRYLFGNQGVTGQSSSPSVAVTVHDQRINDVATEAVRRIDPRATGVFCVDLKENSEGVPKVTEVNAGRFFTTSYFFTNAGCNMPSIYMDLALGREPGNHRQYNAVPAGLYWIRMMDYGYRMMTEDQWTAHRLALMPA